MESGERPRRASPLQDSQATTTNPAELAEPGVAVGVPSQVRAPQSQWLPNGSWLRGGVCRPPREEGEISPANSLALEGGGGGAASSATAAAARAVAGSTARIEGPQGSVPAGAGEDEPVPPDALDQKFEDEFQKHLKKSNKTSRMAMGAVGAGLGAGLGFLASPVLLPGLVIAGIAGSAGGYQLGKMKGLKRLAKHGKGGSGVGGSANAAAHQRPTLRRLRYLVRWGHWQLLEYEDSPLEWTAAVLTEVVKAFSQWVQAMFLVRARLAGGSLEADAEAQEIFQHLAPLYQCLQRGVFSEAIAQSCSFIETACAAQAVDAGHAELCSVIFPTILETISVMDRLAPATHAKFAAEAPPEDAGSPISTSTKSKSKSKLKSASHVSEQEVVRPMAVQKTQGRQRLKKIVDSVRGVLEQPSVVEAIANPKPLPLERFQSAEEQQDCGDVFDTVPLVDSAESSPPSRAASDPDLVEAANSSTSPQPPLEVATSTAAHVVGAGVVKVPGSPEVRGSPSRSRMPKLVVPPLGVEEEVATAGVDDEFQSCSEDEAPSSGSPTGATASGSSDSSPVSKSKSSAGPAPATGKFQDRLTDFPRGRQSHQWDIWDAATFNVRSATYLTDRKKAPSGPSLLELVNIDFFRIPSDGPISHPATRRGFYPMEHRRQKDGRFLFIQNWVFAPFQALIVSALDPQAPWLLADTPQARVWRRFLDGSVDEHRNAFKVIACVENGPWLVKRAAPKKPVLVGRQLKMETRHEPGEFIEITIDVSKSKADAMAVGMVMKALSRLELVLAMVIEGKQDDELPETLLVCAAMKGIDTSRLLCPDLAWNLE